MEQFDLYKDIAERTNGDIYIGVVGPVRSGKSTFIKRFMDLLVLPALPESAEKQRMTDELPQSGSGKTVMTTQPQFVPAEAVKIRVNEHTELSVRLVDCVGYLINGTLGHTENDLPRLVRTPWSDEEMPFEKAAELGTRKVIRDHSTIGIVVTGDGSFTGLERTDYIEAEERVIRELKALGKPFAVVYNTAEPFSPDAQKLEIALEEKYQVPVIPLDVAHMETPDLHSLLERVLYEFPLREIRVRLPKWMRALPEDHPLIAEILEAFQVPDTVKKMEDAEAVAENFTPTEHLTGLKTEELLPGQGALVYALDVQPELFYRILGEECGCEIKGDYHLIAMMRDLITAKKEYDRIADALKQVEETGIGIVSPSMEEMKLEEPEIIRHGGHCGIRLKASAPSLQLMKINVNAEVNPLVGSEKQSEELVTYLMSEFENDPARLWESNMFGKSLHELVMEGLETKLDHVPGDAQKKIQKTMERIVNEGGGGLICILL